MPGPAWHRAQTLLFLPPTASGPDEPPQASRLGVSAGGASWAERKDAVGGGPCHPGLCFETLGEVWVRHVPASLQQGCEPHTQQASPTPRGSSLVIRGNKLLLG